MNPGMDDILLCSRHIKSEISRNTDTRKFTQDATDRLEETVRILELAHDTYKHACDMIAQDISDDEFVQRFDETIEKFLERELEI